jgi:hypothetical protein
METTKYETFDPVAFLNDVPDGFSCMVCAARRQGKTVLITDWISKMQTQRKWAEVYLFSETAYAQTDAYKFVPSQNKFQHLDTDKIDQIFSEQSKKKQRYDSGTNKDIHRVLIIADDVINDKKARNTGSFGRIFTQGRHYFIDVFCISQTLKGFSPMARSNSDLMVLWRSLKYDDRDCVCEDYLMIADGKKSEVKKAAIGLLNAMSSVKYRACVIEIHKSSYASETTEYVRHYTASDKLKPKMIGKEVGGHGKHSEEIVKSRNNDGDEIHLNLRFRIMENKKRFFSPGKK